jgi:hypothetical protein
VTEHFAGSTYDFYVLADLPDSREKPLTIGGFRPDVFARASGRLTLIGEAKTVADLETLHTERQIEAFLAYLTNKPGATIVLSTPWVCRASAQNLVRFVARRHGADSIAMHFISDLNDQW